MDLLPLLKKLSEAPGPSGLEEQVAVIVRDAWAPYVDTIEIDRVGSLIAVKQGQGAEPRRRLLLAAHMDEIALMVRKILSYPQDDDGSGFLHVASVGGIDVRHLYGQIVTVHASKHEPRELVGLLGALPSWMLPEERRSKPYNFDELVVDVGMPVRDVKELVSVGDFVTFRQPVRELLNKRVSGKAFDNRASVAAVTVCLENLTHRRHEWDVVAVATAQEETALLGAFTSAYAQKPDAAIAIDVTFGKGPGTTDELTFEIGEGPTIAMGPNVHPGVVKGLKEAAEAIEMKVHEEPQERPGGTDAYGLQIAREGVPTGLISIPLRYMHTTVETLALRDIKRAGRLLAEFTVRLDSSFLDDIAAAMMED